MDKENITAEQMLFLVKLMPEHLVISILAEKVNLYMANKTQANKEVMMAAVQGMMLKEIVEKEGLEKVTRESKSVADVLSKLYGKTS